MKSGEEQGAILANFQNFLNTLDFPVQILSQSRKYDINPYLNILEQKKKEQISELLKIQTQEYINFIKKFVANSNIMSKKFFVVISLETFSDPLANSKFSFFNKKKEVTENLTFEENLSQLEQRVNLVEGGLSRSGIKTERVDSEELLKLYYRIFNPLEDEGNQ